MDHPEGAGLQRADRVDFDPRVRLEFRGTQLSSDGGLLVMRELDDALGLSDLASAALRDTRSGKNTVHRLDGLFRQSVFGRLAGYEDVNDANRLACDPVMRQVVGGRAVDAQAASASQMGRFETETLALAGNRAALADLNGQWIDPVSYTHLDVYKRQELMAVILTTIKEGVAIGAVFMRRIELAAFAVARGSVTLDIAQMRAGTAALPCGPDAALLDDHAAAARLAMMPVAGYVPGAHEARAPAALHALATSDHGAGPPRR